MSGDILMFEKPGCPYCARARRHLRNKKIAFRSVRCRDVDDLKEKIRSKHLRVPRTLTFPRVFKNGRLVGGSDDVLKKL